MKSLITVLGAVLAVHSGVAIAQTVQPAPAQLSTLPQITSDTEARLKKIEDDYKARIETQSKALADLSEEIKKMGGSVSDRQKADELFSKQLDTVKEIQDATTQKRNALIRERYSKGSELIRDMKGSASTVLFITQLLTVTNMLAKSTNIWRDEEFRNGFDELSDWGTVAGVVVGGVGSVFLATGKDQSAVQGGAWTLAGGVGVVGVSKLLGNLFGKDNGNRMKEKAQFIELTRRAYDDLSDRVDSVKSFEQSNDDFLKDLATFQTKYNDILKFKPSTDDSTVSDEELKRRALNELALKVDRFTLVVGQLSIILNSYDVVVKKYSASEVKMVQQDMQEIEHVLDRAQTNYQTNVKPFLELEDRITALFGRVQ